jgi:DNA-binding GntR family transcriptional regulator
MELALETTTVHDQVYRKLHRLIVSGGCGPGERLDERALAQALGVSRTPVREAVTRLVSDGLVEHRPYQGNFVRSFTAEQVAGLYDARRVLEVLAIREAVPRLTEEMLAAIRGALDRACSALAEGDMAGFGDADRTFHQLINECSGNETLVLLLQNLDAQIQIVRAVANCDPRLVERTLIERDGILAALKDRDADRAAMLMAEHIDDVKRTVVDQLAGAGTLVGDAQKT